MNDACAEHNRIAIVHGEAEFMDLSDGIVNRRLHQKPILAQIQERDRDIERSDVSMKTFQDLDSRTTPTLDLCADRCLLLRAHCLFYRLQGTADQSRSHFGTAPGYAELSGNSRE